MITISSFHSGLARLACTVAWAAFDPVPPKHPKLHSAQENRLDRPGKFGTLGSLICRFLPSPRVDHHCQDLRCLRADVLAHSLIRYLACKVDSAIVNRYSESLLPTSSRATLLIAFLSLQAIHRVPKLILQSLHLKIAIVYATIWVMSLKSKCSAS